MITFQTPPPDEKVVAQLQLVAETDRYNHFHDDGSAPLSLSRPLPVYLTPLELIKAGKLLEAAEIECWQYFVFRDGTVLALAEAAQLGPASEWTYCGAYPAEYAAALWKEIERAEDVSKDSSFELRVLIVPGLLLRAVWLHSNEGADRLLPIAPTPVDFGPEPFVSEARMIEILRPLAEQRLQFSSDERPPGG